MSGDPWYPVGPKDIFPEEFATFLLTDPRVRDAFCARHAELLTARWWQETATANAGGRAREVLSYGPRASFGPPSDRRGRETR